MACAIGWWGAYRRAAEAEAWAEAVCAEATAWLEAMATDHDWRGP